MNTLYKHVEKLEQFGNQELSVRPEDSDGIFKTLADSHGGKVALNFTIALEINNFLSKYGYSSYAEYLRELIDTFGNHVDNSEETRNVLFFDEFVKADPDDHEYHNQRLREIERGQ